MTRSRAARVEDIHTFAAQLPEVTIKHGGHAKAAYQVGGRSFLLFRTPRPDAVDPETGERFTDVIVIWVESEEDKTALVEDESTPFFTTPHFDGHASVLLRSSRVRELTREELAEMIHDAWLARAPARKVKAWLAERGLES